MLLFFITVSKYLTRSNLKNKGTILADCFRMRSITAGKVWRQGHLIAYLHCSDQEGAFEQEVEPGFKVQPLEIPFLQLGPTYQRFQSFSKQPF